jgi:hypothetical protein
VYGCLLFATSVHSAEIRLAGAEASWHDLVVITNSVSCAAVLSEIDHTVVSTSEVDTCFSLTPSWGSWSNVPDGTLDVWIEAVGDGSNVVSVLLGDPATPALTVAFETDWVLVPAGTLPPDEPAVPRFGVTTNRIHFALRLVAGPSLGRAFVETQAAGGSWTPRPDLIPANFGRLEAPQLIPNWTKVGLWTAGPQAALTDLRMRWCVDGTAIICW